MGMTRRTFFKNGVTAFTLGFAAPRLLTDLALAQGMSGRSLVVLYLGGGNDALSFLVPYTDGAYYSRRPTQGVQASTVLPIGSDSNGNALGLHPRLGGFKSMYDAGQVAIIQRTGYPDASRSHFRGTDPLVAWNTIGQLPRTLQAATVGVPSIPDPATYAFASPSGDAETEYATAAAAANFSHLPPANPHLSFVNSTAQAALATLDRVAMVADYAPAVDYPDTGLGQALRAVAGAMVTQVGTQVFWVQTGGYDTHAGQDTATGYYAALLSTLDQAVLAFRNDLTSHGLFDSTMVLQFSEFGRRVSENGSSGTDHGAAGLMMALGGRVAGGLYGTAASLVDTPDNPTLENSGRDVKHETDFRSVYARVIDDWLGASSVALLGSDFRNSSVDFV